MVRRRNHRHRGERGAALLLVLTAITVLSAFSVEFAYNMRVSVHQEANLRREVQAYFHARSAMEIARSVIFADKLFGSLPVPKNVETWRYACMFAEIFSSGKAGFLGQELIDLSESEGIGVENGGFQCEIVAEDGKINVGRVGSQSDKTALAQELYAILREYFGIDSLQSSDKEAIDLIVNIIDWSDTDESRSDVDETGTVIDTGGAEGGSAGYSRYGYEARNAKPDTNEELRLIEGMTDDLFCEVGTKLSVYSTGNIDVNDAHIDVLKALICEFIQGDSLAVCQFPTVQLFPGGPAVRLVDIIGVRLETCRMIASALMMPAFNNAQKFTQAVTAAASEAGQPIQLNQQLLGKAIGFKSKILRIRARGYTTNKKNEVLATKTLEAVVDTATDAFVYWREF